MQTICVDKWTLGTFFALAFSVRGGVCRLWSRAKFSYLFRRTGASVGQTSQHTCKNEWIRKGTNIEEPNRQLVLIAVSRPLREGAVRQRILVWSNEECPLPLLVNKLSFRDVTRFIALMTASVQEIEELQSFRVPARLTDISHHAHSP